MSRQYFGTDGIRGKANVHPMTADFALRLAYATAAVLGKASKVVIGKDTRLSGYMLEQAMTSGFVAAGVDVSLLGPLPTPAVAHLTQKLGADFGVMISASHNPYEDNGIKLIGPDGYKLSDETELAIEAALNEEPKRVQGAMLGKALRVDNALTQYEQYLYNGLDDGASLAGLKIVIDGANGAAYRVAPDMFQKLGADVIPLHITPDGMNINKDCGATHTESLCEAVVKEGAHLGIALDGDADRVILVDETGKAIDGDQILAVLSEDLEDGAPVISQFPDNFPVGSHVPGCMGPNSPDFPQSHRVKMDVGFGFLAIKYVHWIYPEVERVHQNSLDFAFTAQQFRVEYRFFDGYTINFTIAHRFH